MFEKLKKMMLSTGNGQTSPIDRLTPVSCLTYIAVGLAAGFVNGLLGSGGGLILIAFYAIARHLYGVPTLQDAFARNIAAVSAMSLVSAISYLLAGNISLTQYGNLLLPTLAGGLCGAFLLDKIPTVLLRRLFAIMLIIAGFLFIFR